MRVENFVLPLNGEVFKSRSLWLRHWSKREPAYENQEPFPKLAKGCILATRIKIKHVYQRKGGGGGSRNGIYRTRSTDNETESIL